MLAVLLLIVLPAGAELASFTHGIPSQSNSRSYFIIIHINMVKVSVFCIKFLNVFDRNDFFNKIALVQ